MANIVPVSLSRHGAKQLLPRTSWAFAASQQAVSLLLPEFPLAAPHLPIVFVRMKESWLPSALLGLERGRNALVDGDGNWQGGYIPSVLRRHPFVMIRKEEGSSDFALCVDEESGRLADSGGEPLFTADGKQSPALENAVRFATEQMRVAPAGEQLGALLAELGLLMPLALKRGEEEVRLEGFAIVAEKKLNDLADEAFLRLRAAGMLPAVYAHLLSLHQLERLAKGAPAGEASNR